MSKEIKVAIIVIMGLVFLIFGFKFLKASPILDTNNTFYAVFNHSGGLQQGTAVTINGVRIGSVKSLKIDQETAKIIVEFSSKKDFNFSKNSTAQIFGSLLGTAGLEILPALDNAEIAKSGDTLSSKMKVGLMDNLETKIDPMTLNLNQTLTSADALLKNFNNTLNDKAQADIQQSLTSLNASLQNLTKITSKLDKAIAQSNLDKTMQNVEHLTTNFAKISDDLQKANFDKTLTQMNETLTKVNSLLASVEKGDGTIGKLLTDKKLYDNLKTASSEMGLLLEDLRRNPKRYVHISVFGKKNQEYETPNNVEASITERQENLNKN